MTEHTRRTAADEEPAGREVPEDVPAAWMVALRYRHADDLSPHVWEGLILNSTRGEALRFARRHARITVEADGEGHVTRIYHGDSDEARDMLADVGGDFTEDVVELAAALSHNVYLRDDPEPFDQMCDAFDHAAREIEELGEEQLGVRF